jgi:hypothetical protein
MICEKSKQDSATEYASRHILTATLQLHLVLSRKKWERLCVHRSGKAHIRIEKNKADLESTTR